MHDIVPKHNHVIHGLDTETYKGYAKLLTDSTGNYLDVTNIEGLLDFLSSRKFEISHNFFYNIRFDFQAVIKWLPEENLRELYLTGKTKYKDYRIGYIPKKLFKITKKHHVYKYYDLAQFYSTSLANAAEKYLRLTKNKENIDAARLNVDLQYWSDNYDNILLYCLNDSRLTKLLGEHLQDILKTKLKFIPQAYISKASISKEYFRLRCNFTDIRKIPLRVLKEAFNAYHGGRFEVLQKGNVGRCTLLDINSAYPYQIANLRSLDKITTDTVSSVSKDAIYGFYHCKVFVPPAYFQPIPIRINPYLSIFPSGEFETYLTKEEIEAFKYHADVNIIEGSEVYSDHEEYPFRNAMLDLHKLKSSTSKTDFKYSLIKIIMNALYGSFYEKLKKGHSYYAGKMFNPIYASLITANTRIEVFKKALQYGDNVIGFATDSVLISGDVDNPENTELGGWGLERKGESIVFKSGMYKIGDKVKSRGIQKAYSFETPYGEFNTLFDYMRAKPELTEYEIITHRPVNLGEAIVHTKKRSIKEINIWTEFKKTYDINRDIKRLWFDTFENGGDLLSRKIDSIPVMLGYEAAEEDALKAL